MEGLRVMTNRNGPRSGGADPRAKIALGVSHRAFAAALLVAAAAANHAGAQSAPETVKTARSADAAAVAQVTVYGETVTAGGGVMKAEAAPAVVETLSRAYIALQSPTANPLLIMETLPSVNVSTVDAFGLNGGGNAQIHGLSTNDLGWILDGVPVYSQGAGFSNEMIAVQDLETLSVEPGSSNLSDPTISSAAGTIYLKMRDPAMTRGGYVEMDYGSLELNKEFIRLDSGELGETGVRAFVSFSHAFVNNWRGAGSTDGKHLDLKVVKDWANGSRLAFEVSANQQYYGYYYFPTASQFQNYVADSPQFNTNKIYGGIGNTSFYKLNMQNPFNFLSMQLPGRLVVNSKLTISDTPYLWLGVGGGTGGTDLTQGAAYQGALPANVDLTVSGPTLPAGTQVLANTGFAETTVQAGNTLKFDLTLGANAVQFGWWYEYETQDETDAIGKVDQATGIPYPASITGYLKSSSEYFLANGQPYYANFSHQGYTNNTLFFGDTLTLLESKLTVSAGLKEAFLHEFANNLLPGAPYHSGITVSTPLPQASIRYQIDSKNQVFAHIERDYRLPFTFSLVAGFGLTSGALTTNASSPSPETALKEEVGYRYQGDVLLADVSFFNIHLTNRLLTLNTYLDGNPVSETVNAGGQTSRGIDAQVSTHPLWGHFTPYASFEYLDAKITTDTPVPNINGIADYLPTKGKTQVQSPDVQAALGLTYTNGPFSAGVRVRFTDSQYSTLMDDEKEPAYVTDDLSISYQFHKMSGNVQPKIQVNLFNLTNSLTQAGVYQFQYNASNAIGRSGAIIPASGSPTYYVQPSFAAVVSISTPF
jgi:iron complex outermembrane receptor protein